MGEDVTPAEKPPVYIGPFQIQRRVCDRYGDTARAIGTAETLVDAWFICDALNRLGIPRTEFIFIGPSRFIDARGGA